MNPPRGHFGYPQNSLNSWKILKEHGGRRYQNTCCRAKILQYHVEFDWHLSLLSNQKVVFWRHTQTSESHVLLWLFHLHSCKNRFHNIVFVSWWKKINIITVSEKIMFSKFDFPKIHRFSYFVLFLKNLHVYINKWAVPLGDYYSHVEKVITWYYTLQR